MVNHSVNQFYNHFIFKIDALQQYIVLPLNISKNLLNNLSPNVRKFWLSEEIQALPRPLTGINHQRNERIIFVRNTAAEAENKIRIIKAVVQPVSYGCYPSTLMGILGLNRSIHMYRLGGRFQARYNNSIMSIALENSFSFYISTL